MKRLAVALLLICLGSARTPAAEFRLAVAPGDPFPDFAFEALAAADDYAALGLPRSAGPFRLSEVPGDLLVLEFFNEHCLNCQRQAPLMESFFRGASAGDLAGRVRVLGVGVGSRTKDLRDFRRTLKVTYPMAADPEFDRYLELGDPGGTPFSLFLRRSGGQWIFADWHFGLEGDLEMTARTRVLLAGKSGAPPGAAAAVRPRQRGASALSDAEQLARASRLLAGLAGAGAKVEAVELPGQGRLYRALGADGKPLGLYARFAHREPVCDLCHAIEFLFAFDDQGTARGFEVVGVTKYGNEAWSADDEEKLRGRLVGRKLEGLAFNADVDAVTSGTISSSLIFDEVRRAAALLSALPRP